MIRLSGRRVPFDAAFPETVDDLAPDDKQDLAPNDKQDRTPNDKQDRTPNDKQGGDPTISVVLSRRDSDPAQALSELSDPEELSDLTESVLAETLIDAALADETKNRKLLGPPNRSGRAAHARRKGKNTLTTYKRLRSFLRALAVRALGDLTTQGHPTPDEEMLTRALESYAWDHHGHLIDVQEPGEPRTGGIRGWTFTNPDGVAHAAQWAASEALSTRSWSSEGRQELRDRAAQGGLNSKRHSPHIDALRILDHDHRSNPLGPTAAGRELGISPEWVRRLRKRIAQEDSRLSAELDDLFPEIAPDSQRSITGPI